MGITKLNDLIVHFRCTTFFTTKGRIGGLFYFTWGADAMQPDAYIVYRCSAITEAGKLALKPM